MTAGQSRRILNPPDGTFCRTNVETYYHTAVTTTSGTLSTTAGDTAAISGLTVSKTATETGRYTIQTPTPHKRRVKLNVNILGADDAAYGATTLGLVWFMRDDDIASDGTIEIQFVDAATYADAEILNGASFDIELIVEG